MLFIFALVPTLVSAVGALFSLTGGMNFVAAAVAVTAWQKYKGYKPGEGYLTERANDAYYGVCINVNSDFDVNKKLGMLAEAAPDRFKELIGKSFDLTRTESEFLRVLIAPTMSALEDLEVAKELFAEHANEALGLLQEAADRWAKSVISIVCWLEQFPRARVRKIA